MIDLTSLRSALKSLDKASKRSLESPDDEEVRDAVIQRFEYCYELSWKMLRRKLKEDAATPEDVDRMSFKELIREGAVRGFVENPEKWFEYREQRNITSHIYDEKKAKSVYKTAMQFLPDAQKLLDQLEASLKSV
ncbi:MAG: nucleotidyltransferase [Deltaproteobacteria bacterium]|jgi:nucleotidyltransferase substrate binding protein (TIGR01987 family)|nr:nucleotidyltransferase [Deltaproteobacteria bacterium]MBT4643427.1 nucleotidyltransferase [Deltaproteobacteria bacterium]MBT6499533.1 nucleotidyltransferase [Deltaproteobacteria bacterium]MBT7153657.1 nucleotidyltransferase [Deltaproteobacteria bacterium]MBT7713552.1 nucleotidyltransferase [Deltaproteobacteria bacterium]